MEYTSKQRTKIMACLCIACFVSSMCNSAMSVSLPSIMTLFNAEQTQVQPLLTYYSMILGVMSACSAFLVNRFKTKNLFITCIAGFCIASAGIAISPNVSVMLVFRILQALSAGSISTMSLMVALRIFPEGRKGTGTGIIGTIMFASPALAPTICGFLIDTVGFRGIFVAVAIVLAIVLVMSLFFMVSIDRVGELPTLDVISLVLYAAGFACVNIGLPNIAKYGFGAVQTYGVLGAAVILLVIFAVRNVKSDKGLLRLRLFKSRKFTFCVYLACIIYLNMMLVEQMSQQYLQVIRGYSAKNAGLIATAASILVILIAFLGGKYYDKKGGKSFCVFGFLAMTAGTVGLIVAGTWMPIVLVAVCYGVSNLSNGWLLQPMNAYLSKDLPAEDVNQGVAIANSLRMIVASVLSNAIVSSASAFSGSNGLDLRGYTIAMCILGVLIAIGLLITLFGLKKGN